LAFPTDLLDPAAFVLRRVVPPGRRIPQARAKTAMTAKKITEFLAHLRGAPGQRVVLSRLGFALATLLLMSLITFAATSIAPEDVARNALGREVTQGQVELFIHDKGLDRPFAVRYAEWLAGAATGDFGVSAVTGRDVRADVMPRLGNTVVLALLALVIGVPLSLGVAVYMALRMGGWQDVSLLAGTTVLTALPEFVTGMGLVLLFGVTLGWLPIDSTALLFGSAFDNLSAYVLPVTTMVLVTAPYTIRIARSSICESLASAHTRAAILNGLSRRRILWAYAVLPAATPIINTLALNLVYLISGVVVIENVFNFPGIGRRLVEAITTGDTYTVQAVALLMGAMFIIINLAADLMAAYVNPRLRAR